MHRALPQVMKFGAIGVAAGVGLALLYERNGSLAAPVAMHAVFNAVNVVAILLLGGGGGG